MADKKFVNGLIYKLPRDGAPDFILANLSIKVIEFKNFLLENQEGDWMNIDVKKNREGKIYCEVNTWKPNGTSESTLSQGQKDEIKALRDKENLKYPEEEINTDDIPF